MNLIQANEILQNHYKWVNGELHVVPSTELQLGEAIEFMNNFVESIKMWQKFIGNINKNSNHV